MKLTNEQRVIAEENHNLIYSFISRYNLDIDEYYDIIAIGYCKAIATYDSSKGYALSTYCYKCMYNEYLINIRSNNTSKSIPQGVIYYLEDKAYSNDNDLTLKRYN